MSCSKIISYEPDTNHPVLPIAAGEGAVRGSQSLDQLSVQGIEFLGGSLVPPGGHVAHAA